MREARPRPASLPRPMLRMSILVAGSAESQKVTKAWKSSLDLGEEVALLVEEGEGATRMPAWRARQRRALSSETNCCLQRAHECITVPLLP